MIVLLSLNTLFFYLHSLKSIFQINGSSNRILNVIKLHDPDCIDEMIHKYKHGELKTIDEKK